MTRSIRAVLALAVAFATAGCGATDQTATPRAPHTTTATADWEALETGWTRLPAPPASVGAHAVSVWTGRELVYWGGETYAGSGDEGAAYDPAARNWDALPPAPLDRRASPAAVWTGTEVLIWGGAYESDGAAFDPTSGSWRMLPAAPLAARVPAAYAWTGREMLVWGDAHRGAEAVDGAAYDPARDAWRSLPPAPLALNQATAVWSGKEMIVVGSLLDTSNWSEAEHASAIAYDPRRNSWRTLPPYPLSPQASTAVWTGRELIAWDYELRAGAYDPTRDAWRELPDLPLRFYECYPQSAVVADVVLAWHCGQAAAFDPASDTWRVLRRAPTEIYGPPVSAGAVALFAGAAKDGTRRALWAFTPPRAATSG